MKPRRGKEKEKLQLHFPLDVLPPGADWPPGIFNALDDLEDSLKRALEALDTARNTATSKEEQ